MSRCHQLKRLLDATKDEHLGLEGIDEKRIAWFATKTGLLHVFAFGSLGALVSEVAATDWGGVPLADLAGRGLVGK